LLFYIGWVRTDALFQEFGVDASELKLSVQDYLLRSVTALYVPLGTATLVALLALWTHQIISRLIVKKNLASFIRWAAALGLVLGVALLLRGILGVARPTLSRDDFLVTPLCLALGPFVIVYCRGLSGRLVDPAQLQIRGPKRLSTISLVEHVLVGVLVAVGLFWAITRYAQADGRAWVRDFQLGINSRPTVTLYSTEPLLLPPPITVKISGSTEDKGFRYEYGNLQLLISANGRLLLLPGDWVRNRGRVIVLDERSDMRVEFSPR
jgi:hypothetical protein